jgi:peptidoglycan hydrolase-like protein with peptidoglycan-binding domain
MLVILCIGLGLAACGGGSSTSATTGGTLESTHTVSTPAPAEPEAESPVAGVEVVASTLQLDLEQLGYRPGSVTGTFTDATQQALKRFQADSHVAMADYGALGPGTADALAARLHGANNVVLALQSALTDVDLFHATINGRYDAATIAAVSALQTRARIAVDGFYGPQTGAALVRLFGHADPEPVEEESAEPGSPTTTTTTTTATDHRLDLLTLGSTGESVKRLQQRLTTLGYRPGAADSSFGAATASAVLAFQKREGLERDSVVGPSVESALAAAKAAGPRNGPVPRIDIDIARQLLFVVLKTGSVITLNSSTGNGERYSVPGGGTDVAYTPVGDFNVIRKVPGDEQAPLGTLRNPLYFYRGWAIHGASNVPAYPASHGCARISNADADWLFPRIPLGTPVIVYDTSGRSPSVSDAPASAAPGY